MVYPLRHQRVRCRYRGGARIDALTGVEGGGNGYFAEDWIASDVKASLPGLEGGEPGITLTAEGMPLPRLLEAEGEALLGPAFLAAYGPRMPILVKLLDACQRLAIQAHPTVEFARAHFHSPFGKTECWYILEAEPRACVFLGFQQGISREIWREAFEKQAGMLRWLHRLPVKAGDCFLVPGGMPHAIGGGCLMVELQEPTDFIVITEKVNAQGEPFTPERMHNGLGFQKMLDCFVYDGLTEQALRARCQALPQELGEGLTRIMGPPLTDKFFMDRLRVQGCRTLQSGGSLRVAVVLAGEGTLGGLPARQGGLFLIPAAEKEIHFHGDLDVALCAPGTGVTR